MTFWNWFFLLLIFVPLLIVYAMTIWNIFTRPGVSGLFRAGWLVAVIVLPFVGTLIYLAAFGGDMTAPGMTRFDRAKGNQPV